jgi:hypothetical protein
VFVFLDLAWIFLPSHHCDTSPPVGARSVDGVVGYVGSRLGWLGGKGTFRTLYFTLFGEDLPPHEASIVRDRFYSVKVLLDSRVQVRPVRRKKQPRNNENFPLSVVSPASWSN